MSFPSAAADGIQDAMNRDDPNPKHQSTEAALDWLLATPKPKKTAVATPPQDWSQNFFVRHWRLLVAGALGAALLGFFGYAGFIRAPVGFPAKSYVSIAQGMSMREVALLLREKSFIRSPLAFKVLGILFGGSSGIKAGEYYFAEPVSVATLSWRLAHGEFNVVPIRILIPEGYSNQQVSAAFKKVLPKFNEARFLKAAAPKEGYLFPDTYDFLPSAAEGEVIDAMSENFKKRTAPLADKFTRFGKPLREVIILASLLEEEARTTESRQKIAGILWKRLEAKMPLQVDAVFPYIFGDKPFDLTDGDLLVDSPYNTYKYAGLPPGPISNPGLDSIRAAVTPIATPYWYYLSDRDGNMHYAVTHDEHLRNREKYLGK